MSVVRKATFRLVAPVAPEDDLHIAVAKMLAFAIAPPGVASRHGVMWFSIESRNIGGRTFHGRDGDEVPVEAVRRKKIGCVSGIPDIFVLFDGKVHPLELKTLRKGSGLSVAQNLRHEQLRLVGVVVSVPRTLDAVIEAIRERGIPLTHRVAA